MEEHDIENQKVQQLVALTAQRTALLAAMDMHIRRSEEVALQVQLIDQEIEQLTQEVPT
jgi:hypothetical protein